MNLKPILTLFLTAIALCRLPAADATPAADGLKVLTDLPYKTGELSDYEKERCKLDLYLPPGEKGFPTLVWFHGGGLTGGSKSGDQAIARSLVKAGVGFATAEYRLSPKTKFPGYVEDSAAAFAWVHAHIAEYGGDPGKLFIGGHSAGGYLTMMIGLDAKYLRAAGLELSAIAGLIPVSGGTVTHFNVRAERGIAHSMIIADDEAPVYYCRKETPPMLVLYAEHDMPMRAEEDALLVAAMKDAGNQRVTGKLILDRTHGSIAGGIAHDNDPARLAILDFIKSPDGASAEQPAEAAAAK
jgi:acetyl esterase/lipase